MSGRRQQRRRQRRNGGAASCNGSTPMVAPAPTACPATAGTTPPDTALAADVNDLRAHMGLTCMALVPEINTSAQKHCDYYQQNMADKVCTANAHVEVATCPGFVAENFNTRMTDAGYKGSPRSEVMAFSGDPSSALGQWINSVYHRTPLLSPWIHEMGYGMTADCDTIDMGQGAKTPDDVTAVYPYPGQVDLPLSFDGSHEGINAAEAADRLAQRYARAPLHQKLHRDGSRHVREQHVRAARASMAAGQRARHSVRRQAIGPAHRIPRDHQRNASR